MSMWFISVYDNKYLPIIEVKYNNDDDNDEIGMTMNAGYDNEKL